MVLMVAVAMLTASCAVVTPRTFERVVVDAEQNGDKYTDEDWQKADKMFEAFSDKYDYERLTQLSQAEQREIGRLTARYLKVRARSAIGEMGKALRAGSEVLRGFMEGIGISPVAAPMPADPDDE